MARLLPVSAFVHLACIANACLHLLLVIRVPDSSGPGATSRASLPLSFCHVCVFGACLLAQTVLLVR